MNFIKKKIKGSKKSAITDDDDLDPNLFHVPQATGGAWVPYDERVDEESEEWRAFRQLTQRVTDTLQETKQNLSKIVASTALSENSRDIRTVVSPADDTQQHQQNGRPPPPPLQQDPAAKAPAPPRPPPPAATAASQVVVPASRGPVPVPVPLPLPASLFLDDDDFVTEGDDDPFDTSFVNAPPASSRVVEAIKGVISDDELDAFGGPGDDDDPFVVKESVLLETMDPFDSFLQDSVATGRPEIRSPNPFLVDSAPPAPPPPPPVSSSNPFTCDSTADDDLFNGTRMSPNPFASMMTTQPSASSIPVDLFGFDVDGAVTTMKSSSNMSREDDPFDFFGVADAAGPVALDGVSVTATTECNANPFVATKLFDPFEVGAETHSGGGDLLDSLLLSSQSFGSSLLEDHHRVVLPPAPSAENLFALDDDDRSSCNAPPSVPPFVPELEISTQPVPPATSSPVIDFFCADSNVVNVSGVSVELSQVSPAKMDSDDEFFVTEEEDEKEVAPPPPRPSPGPPPRPPPPSSPSKPARPPPPNFASSAARGPDGLWDAFSYEEPIGVGGSSGASEDIAGHQETEGDFFGDREKDSSAAVVAPVDILGFLDDEVGVGVAAPAPTKEVAADLFSQEALFTSDVPPADVVAEPSVADDAFDIFEAKFQSAETSSSLQQAFDPFGSATAGGGGVVDAASASQEGFGATDDFDPFFALKEPPAAPKPSPARFPGQLQTGEDDESESDSDDAGPDFSVFIRPKMKEKGEVPLHLGPIPVLAPPPKSPVRSPPSPRVNPFDREPEVAALEAEEEQQEDVVAVPEVPRELPGVVPGVATEAPRIGATQASVESPGSPLFEADDTEPLEDFCPKRPASQGWELMLRQPSKKKLTGQRFWKKIYLTLSDNGVLHLYNKPEDKDAFQELPLQACYSLTEIGAQQYDTYGKIFTVKLQYVFYRERVGVRPGQISKVTHGQITSLGQLAKLGLPLEHSPQVSQLLKLGTQGYDELQSFIREVEDNLFHLTVHRDRALTYKTEEVQVTVVDELYAEVQCNAVVTKQLARVRVFFLAFIVGMPDVELGLNDITKQGKEVVGRHDIIPVVTEEWIRLEKCEFHSCVMTKEFEKSRSIKFHPPDACFFEILRFRIRPPRNRELPLQVRPTMTIIGNRVEIRADVLVPGCISRKHGQIPCEDVAIRFPLPECWIYLFRVEKHFRYGSIKSAARKPGKIKGLERIMGAGLSMEPSMIEVSTGQAKYEHQHRAIVWRVPRLPKDGQGAYTTQLFVCRLELTSYDQIPPEFDHYIYVEFTMPATTVSHTTVRSVSLTNPNPPEKYVRYLARHKYRVEMEHAAVASECDYVAATGAAGNGSSSSDAAPSQHS